MNSFSDPIKRYLTERYIKVVGYDPFADDPSLAPEIVAETLMQIERMQDEEAEQ